ncbi:NDUFB6, partial [Biomphalaria pfeifferi]
MANVTKLDPVMEKPWQRARRMERYDFWRKSSYPPMNIEPVPFERNRLAGEGMSPEVRALRKQFYRFLPDLIFFGPVKAIVGYNTALLLRLTLPKIGLVFGASYLVWYHLKYNQRDWTREAGVIIYGAKPTLLGFDALNFPSKEKTDYCERGFKERKALLYKPTSKSDTIVP